MITTKTRWGYVATLTCSDCGTTVKSSAALMNHRGSQRCQVEATKRMMSVRGWEEVHGAGKSVIKESSADYEEAPVDLSQGGLTRNAAEPEWRAPLTKAGKPRYGRVATAKIIMGVWAPAWAARFLNSVFGGAPVMVANALGLTAALNYGARSQSCAEALTAAYALGGLDAVSALVEVPQQEEDCA